MKGTPICVMAACLGGSILWLPDTGRCTALSYCDISSGTRFSSSGEDAQNAGLRSISGMVLDPSGAAIAGADVILLSGDGKELSRLTSDQDGNFQFENLPVLPYHTHTQ